MDYIAQELRRLGVDVQLDRWTLVTGRRLWEQTAAYIQDPTRSAAWVIYATQASLSSEACKEEYSYALDRALRTRGGAFPIIGIFPTHVAPEFVPAGLRTRLYVNLTDADWAERVVAGVEGRAPRISATPIAPYAFKETMPVTGGVMFEVRPRAGVWSPFLAGIPAAELEDADVMTGVGAPGGSPGVVTHDVRQGLTGDSVWRFRSIGDEVSPTRSGYIVCQRRPSSVLFGAATGPQYRVDL